MIPLRASILGAGTVVVVACSPFGLASITPGDDASAGLPDSGVGPAQEHDAADDIFVPSDADPLVQPALDGGPCAQLFCDSFDLSSSLDGPPFWTRKSVTSNALLEARPSASAVSPPKVLFSRVIAMEGVPQLAQVYREIEIRAPASGLSCTWDMRPRQRGTGLMVVAELFAYAGVETESVSLRHRSDSGGEYFVSTVTTGSSAVEGPGQSILAGSIDAWSRFTFSIRLGVNGAISALVTGQAPFVQAVNLAAMTHAKITLGLSGDSTTAGTWEAEYDNVTCVGIY